MSFFILKSQSSLARLTAFVFLVSPVFADTVTLVDGTKIEGEVMSETDELVVVRAKVGGIWDEKRLDAGEVRSIERESPETKAWQDASIALPTADLLTRDDYSKMINKKLKPFLKNFPSGEHAVEAKNQLATLENELARTQAGEVKYDGYWMSAAEYSDRRYWVDAERIYRELQASVEKGSLVTALRRFDELDDNYGDSIAYSAAVTEIRPVLERYDRELSTAIVRAPRLVSQRTEMLETLSPSERARTEAEIMRSDEEAKARAENERADKVKWRTPNPYDESSLKTIQATVRKELERVAELEPAVLERRARVLELIDRTISEGRVEKAQELVEEHDELLKGSNYLKQLEEKLATVIKEREESAIIENTGSEDGTVDGEVEESGSKSGDSEVTTEDVDKTAGDSSGEAADGDQEPVSNEGNDSPVTDVVGEDGEAAVVAPDPVADDPVDETPKTESAAQSSDEEKATEEEKGLSPMILGLLVVLVLILAGAMVVNAKGKKKMQEN